MKKILLLVFCCMSFVISFSQKDKSNIYIFNEDWTPAKDYESCFYFMQQHKENDTTYVNRYYTRTGPMIKWETYKDKEMDLPHGIFAYYNKFGKIDSMGLVYEGKKDKQWLYKDENGKNALEEEYNKGRLIKTTNYLTQKVVYANGIIEDIKPLDSTTKKQDSITKNNETAAQFSGGLANWNRHLQRTLKTPERFIGLYKVKPYRGTVVTRFIIDEEGNLGNIFIEQSCEWSTDSEAIRVLKTSPKWKPASKDGNNIIYRHKQSISFEVG